MAWLSECSVDWRLFEDHGGLADDVIEWLGHHGPDMWHRCAQEENWDWGWRVLGWIVSQRGCARATAGLIFWYAQPQELIDPKQNAAEREDPSSAYYLLRLIIDNSRLSYFSNQDIPVAWDADHDSRVSKFREVLKREPELEAYWSPGLSLIPQIRVAKLPPDEGFIDGVPKEVWGDDDDS